MMVLNWIDQAPRRVLALISVACLGLLAFGMYLQHVVGLEPCPMCIVLRYALIGVAIFTALASARGQKGWWMAWSVLALITAGFGAFVAARQSWLQWYPPEMSGLAQKRLGLVASHVMGVCSGFGRDEVEKVPFPSVALLPPAMVEVEPLANGEKP